MVIKKWFICLKYKLIINRVFRLYFVVKIFRNYNLEEGIFSFLWFIDYGVWLLALFLRVGVLRVKIYIYVNVRVL